MASSYPDPDDVPDDDFIGAPVDMTPMFECRCVECDERFESPRPDFLCDRCDYLNSLDGEE